MDLSHWLLKTEPGTYSFAQLLKEKKTAWNGIRNYQARNFLRQMKKGDPVLIYHSGDEKAVVGIARVVREAYPEPDPDGGDWSQVDIQAVKSFRTSVELKTLKSTKGLEDLPLIKQSRLSAMPISSRHYEILCQLGGAQA